MKNIILIAFAGMVFACHSCLDSENIERRPDNPRYGSKWNPKRSRAEAKDGDWYVPTDEERIR